MGCANSAAAAVAGDKGPWTSLLPDEELVAGEQLTAANNRSKLVFQNDGNVVLFESDEVIWSTNTAGQAATSFYLGTDGLLALYDKDDNVLWSAGASGFKPKEVILQDDRNLVIYAEDGSAPWATGTLREQWIDVDEKLPANDYIESTLGTVYLIVEDGNLVLYQSDDEKVLWQSNTSGSGATYLILQEDGNLVLYDHAGTAHWSSNTVGKASSYVWVDDDKSVSILDSSDNVLWSSS